MRQPFIFLFVISFLCSQSVNANEFNAQAAHPNYGTSARDSIYIVRDVPIEVTAKRASTARLEAYSAGQKKALYMLFERLIPASSKMRLPMDFTDADVAGLVKSIRVEPNSEEVTGGTYRAKLVVEFKPQAVRYYLQRKAIRVTEQKSPPILLLPIIYDKDKPELWSEDDQWKQVLYDKARQSKLVQFVLPLGDLEDRRSVTVTDALSGNMVSLAGFLRRYRAKDLVVVSIRFLDQQEGESKKTKKKKNYKRAEIIVKRFDRDGVIGAKQAIVRASAVKSDDHLQRKASIHVVQLLREAWKRRVVQKSTDEQTVKAYVAFSSADEWGGIRKKLMQTPGLKLAEVSSLSGVSASVVLRFPGSISDLNEHLRKHALELINDGAGMVVRYLLPAKPEIQDLPMESFVSNPRHPEVSSLTHAQGSSYNHPASNRR